MADDLPEPTGPWYANYGPTSGHILFGTAPVMGVLGSPSGGAPLGIAWLAGSIPSTRGPVQLWRLEVGKRELEGRWVVKDRRFVRLGDAAEEV